MKKMLLITTFVFVCGLRGAEFETRYTDNGTIEKGMATTNDGTVCTMYSLFNFHYTNNRHHLAEYFPKYMASKKELPGCKGTREYFFKINGQYGLITKEDLDLLRKCPEFFEYNDGSYAGGFRGTGEALAYEKDPSLNRVLTTNNVSLTPYHASVNQLSAFKVNNGSQLEFEAVENSPALVFPPVNVPNKQQRFADLEAIFNSATTIDQID